MHVCGAGRSLMMAGVLVASIYVCSRSRNLAVSITMILTSYFSLNVSR
jgi:hypothetical protein